MATHYNILGISENATAAEIKSAFRALAKTYHPDHNKNADAKRRFCEVYAAYEILSDPVKRKHYDQLLQQAKTSPGKVVPKTDPINDWSNEANTRGNRYAEMTFDVFAKQVLNTAASLFRFTLMLSFACLITSFSIGLLIMPFHGKHDFSDGTSIGALLVCWVLGLSLFGTFRGVFLWLRDEMSDFYSRIK